MTEAGALLGALFLTGLAGSLHCVGMCGPILIGFSKIVGGRPGLDFALYHAGRVWTYALLGFLVGWLGSELRHHAGLPWQQPLAIVTSLMVIAAGLAALGWIPGLKLDLTLPGGCVPGSGRLRGLLAERRPSARLLLGAIMGLLPCGLVYAALLVAATLPHPLLSAVAMICFGAGTLPALTALVLGGRLLPASLRLRGTRAAALVLVGIGLFMLARTLLVPLMPHTMH